MSVYVSGNMWLVRDLRAQTGQSNTLTLYTRVEQKRVSQNAALWGRSAPTAAGCCEERVWWVDCIYPIISSFCKYWHSIILWLIQTEPCVQTPSVCVCSSWRRLLYQTRIFTHPAIWSRDTALCTVLTGSVRTLWASHFTHNSVIQLWTYYTVTHKEQTRTQLLHAKHTE